MKRLRAIWQSLWGDVDRRVRMGKLLGLLFIAAGFITMGVAWNGAASINLRVDSQFPYLLSGGFIGMGLVVTGAVLLFLATVRAERQVMTERFDTMITLLGRNLSRLGYASSNGSSTYGQVIAGESTYHRPDCKVLEGKENLTSVSVEQAVGEGLSPCRVCEPPVPSKKEEVAEDVSA